MSRKNAPVFFSQTCDKLSFQYKNDAKAKLRRTVRHPDYVEKENKEIKVYKCPRCGFYHLGHSLIKKPLEDSGSDYDQARG